MPLPPLSSLDVAQKRVLLRLDLNIAAHDITKIKGDHRIQTALPVLRELVSRQARIIILAHRGRPDGETEMTMTNEPLAIALQTALGQPVTYVPDITGAAAQAAAKNLKPGAIIILENIRFDPREMANDAAFAAELAALGDVYVNDAFANCHRTHASIVALAGLLPHAAGPLMIHEVDTLSKTLGNLGRPTAAIIGGAKVSTKIALLENLITKIDILFVGGAMANTFLAAEGIDVQGSLYEPTFVPMASHILAQAHGHNCQILLPHDAIVARDASEQGEAMPVMSIPKAHKIFDIGPATIMRLSALLRDCRTLLWNGPVGMFEQPQFASGTIAIAKLVTERTQQGQMFSIAGGGDTIAALDICGCTEKMSYVSTAGGAFLEFMEGKKLPGLAALAS